VACLASQVCFRCTGRKRRERRESATTLFQGTIPESRETFPRENQGLPTMAHRFRKRSDPLPHPNSPVPICNRNWRTDVEDDFRIPVATHVEFLWAQMQTTSSKEKSLKKHLKQPFWGEILPTDLTAVPAAHPPSRSRKRCVATAYVGSLFEWIFGEGVEIIERGHHEELVEEAGSDDEEDFIIPDYLFDEVKSEGPEEEAEVHKGGATRTYKFHHPEYQTVIQPRYTSPTHGPAAVGSVIEVQRDGETRWKKSTQKWHAYVTDKWTTSKGVTKIKIIWLYWPEDVALCMSMKYPFPNEVRPRFMGTESSCFLVIIVSVGRRILWMTLFEKSPSSSFV
jgi:hypothetical protein